MQRKQVQVPEAVGHLTGQLLTPLTGSVEIGLPFRFHVKLRRQHPFPTAPWGDSQSTASRWTGGGVGASCGGRVYTNISKDQGMLV